MLHQAYPACSTAVHVPPQWVPFYKSDTRNLMVLLSKLFPYTAWIIAITLVIAPSIVGIIPGYLNDHPRSRYRHAFHDHQYANKISMYCFIEADDIG